MELVHMFENSQKRRQSVRKELQWMGLTKKTKGESLKNLEEEIVFAGLTNWILNEMPQEESTEIRFRTVNKVYQVTLYYHHRSLIAKGLKVIAEDDAEFILYEWAEGITYENLTTEKIKQSMNKADIMNYDRKNPSMENDEMMKDIFDRGVELTEDDMELIDEFLNV